jgi:hypothetical protein
MKKFILTLGLIATLSTSFVSCSTDDSELEQSADEITTLDGNGGLGLGRPNPKP